MRGSKAGLGPGGYVPQALQVTAARDTNGALWLLAINIDRTNDLATAINPLGFVSTGTASVWTVPVNPHTICELMDLHTTASMYPTISTTDLMRLPFLLPEDATIKKVKQQITAARAARREAHVLLEKAKRAVEVAIDEDEAAGMLLLRS